MNVTLYLEKESQQDSPNTDETKDSGQLNQSAAQPNDAIVAESITQVSGPTNG